MTCPNKVFSLYRMFRTIYRIPSFRDSFLKFFTNWVFVLMFFGRNLPFNFAFLATVVLVVGTYLSHVNPGFFIFDLFEGQQVVMTGWKKSVFVDLMHMIMFVLAITSLPSEIVPLWYFTVNSVMLIFLYMSVLGVEEVYLVPSGELIVPGIVAVFLYVTLHYFWHTNT